MLHRDRHSAAKPPAYFRWLKKGAAVLFVAEAAAFGASYLLWYRLNTNRDFRQYMHHNFPTILDKYYSLGEYLGGSDQHKGALSSIRAVDAEYWRHQQPQQKPQEK